MPIAPAPPPVLTARRVLTVVVALVALWTASGSGSPTVTQTGPEDPAAARAVALLAGPDRGTALAPDVVAGLGYAPTREPGPGGGALLTDPRGACSVPTPARPLLEPWFDERFAALCRAHDLGYDLLRLADRRGGPLGPWAREAIDRRFADDLAATCADRPVCRTVAQAAVASVRANSWRQGEGVPVVETPTRTVVAVLVAFAVLAVGLRRPSGGAAGPGGLPDQSPTTRTLRRCPM